MEKPKRNESKAPLAKEAPYQVTMDPMMTIPEWEARLSEMRAVTDEEIQINDTHYQVCNMRDTLDGMMESLVNDPKLHKTVDVDKWGEAWMTLANKEEERATDVNSMITFLTMEDPKGENHEIKSLLHRRWKHFINAQRNFLDELEPELNKLADHPHPLIKETQKVCAEYRAVLNEAAKEYERKPKEKDNMPHVDGDMLSKEHMLQYLLGKSLSDPGRRSLAQHWSSEDAARSHQIRMYAQGVRRETLGIDSEVDGNLSNPTVMADAVWSESLTDFEAAIQRVKKELRARSQSEPKEGQDKAPFMRALKAFDAVNRAHGQLNALIHVTDMRASDEGLIELEEAAEAKISKMQSKVPQKVKTAEAIDAATQQMREWHIQYASAFRQIASEIKNSPDLSLEQKDKLIKPLKEYAHFVKIAVVPTLPKSRVLAIESDIDTLRLQDFAGRVDKSREENKNRNR